LQKARQSLVDALGVLLDADDGPGVIDAEDDHAALGVGESTDRLA